MGPFPEGDVSENKCSCSEDVCCRVDMVRMRRKEACVYAIRQRNVHAELSKKAWLAGQSPTEIHHDQESGLTASMATHRPLRQVRNLCDLHMPMFRICHALPGVIMSARCGESRPR